MNQYYVYMLASKSGVLYVGMSNDLERRMYEHRNKLVAGFSVKYNVTMLMFYEAFPTAVQAIEAEKRIKGWGRAKKVALIEESNRTWRDLAEDFDIPQDRHSERTKESPKVSATERTEIPREYARNHNACGAGGESNDRHLRYNRRT